MKRILLAAFVLASAKLFAQPATPAPTPPARNATDVISIYSGAYTNVTGVDFNPNWGQSGFAGATTVTVSGNEMRYYPNMNYQGVDFGANVNVSNMTHVHFDIWTPATGTTATNFEFFLINPGPVEQASATTPTAGGWKSVDIPLSSFNNVRLQDVFQLKFVATPFGGTDIYLDNIYFYKAPNVPTLTNFTVAPRTIGAAPFTITAPTSNSAGAFTYTSSNSSVATISGTTVTVVGVGTTTITATQAANGSFVAGSVATTFTVNPAAVAPTAGAPNPTLPSARVTSLFSDVYTNRAVDTWRTSWSAATLTDTVIGGNNMKRYDNLNFVGVEFHSPGPQINATSTDSFHISVWTPNATTFRIKLVDFGAAGTFGGGDDREAEIIFSSDPADANLPNRFAAAPTQGQWNVISIPMSFFASNGLTTRGNLSQLIFSAVPTGSATVFVDNIYFSSGATLPAEFTDFSATIVNNAGNLQWKVGAEINVKNYVVERSVDGNNFSAIGTVVAAKQSQYNFTDKNLLKGIAYYRIKAVDNDGSYKFSVTRAINNRTKDISYAIYPNPAKDVLIIKNLEGINTISLIDATGKNVLTTAATSNNMVSISLSNIPTGLYTVLITNDTNKASFKVVVEK